MKKIIISVISLTLIYISCQQDHKIVGTWVRQDDAFAGMKVKVNKIGNVTNGKIIYLPNSMKMTGFEINDIKWKGIKNIEGNYFEFEDLVKGVDKYGNVGRVDYALTRLLISNNVIKIRVYAKGEEIIGTEQIWVREK